MNKEDVYRQWIDYRRNVNVPTGFESRVMTAVKAQEPQRPPMMVWDHWMASLIGRRAATLALILLGLFRLVYIAGQLVVAGQIAP